MESVYGSNIWEWVNGERPVAPEYAKVRTNQYCGLNDKQLSQHYRG